MPIIQYPAELECSSNPKALLIKLYRHSRTADNPSIFRAKLAPSKNQYHELEIFKNQINNKQLGTHPFLFTNARKKTLAYKLIFWFFSLIFIALGVIGYKHSATWTSAVLFGSTFKTNGMICLTSCSFALASFYIGYCLSSIREATQAVLKRGCYLISRLYQHKKMEFGISSLIPFGEEYRRSSILKRMHNEAIDKMQSYRDAASHLLERISDSENLNKIEKESLSNQAVSDMYDKIKLVLHTFKHVSL